MCSVLLFHLVSSTTLSPPFHKLQFEFFWSSDFAPLMCIAKRNTVCYRPYYGWKNSRYPSRRRGCWCCRTLYRLRIVLCIMNDSPARSPNRLVSVSVSAFVHNIITHFTRLIVISFMWVVWVLPDTTASTAILNVTAVYCCKNCTIFTFSYHKINFK